MAMAKILLCVVFAVGLASAAVEVNMMSDDSVEVTTTQKAGDNCQGAKAGDKCAHPAPLAATAAPS